MTDPTPPSDPWGTPPPQPQDPGAPFAAPTPPPPPPYGAPPPGYGPPPLPYGAPGGYPGQPQGTNTLAIISLIAAFVCTPAGLVCGIIALSQIKRTGQQGRGLALAGTIVSSVLLVLSVLGIIALIAVGRSCSQDVYGHTSC